MSSSVQIDDKNKDIFILGEWPTQGLDDTTLTTETIYPISFTQPNKRFVLSLLYNRSNTQQLFVDLQDVFKTSLAKQFFVFQDVLKTSWRCLEDVLEDEIFLRWRRLEDVLKTCREDVFKTSWRQTKCLLGLSLSNKSKSVSDKSIPISDKSRRIQNALIRIQSFQYSFYLETQAAFLFWQLKSLNDRLVVVKSAEVKFYIAEQVRQYKRSFK